MPDTFPLCQRLLAQPILMRRYVHIGIIPVMHHRNEASILQYTIWKAVINCRLFLAVSDEVADDEGGHESRSSARIGESEGEDGM